MCVCVLVTSSNCRAKNQFPIFTTSLVAVRETGREFTNHILTNKKCACTTSSSEKLPALWTLLVHNFRPCVNLLILLTAQGCLL